jgi:hypothetical protein
MLSSNVSCVSNVSFSVFDVSFSVFDVFSTQCCDLGQIVNVHSSALDSFPVFEHFPHFVVNLVGLSLHGQEVERPG